MKNNTLNFLKTLNTSSSYRLSQVLLRISMAANGVLLVVIIGFFGSFLYFLPLKTIHPVFIRIADKSAQITDINVLRPSKSSNAAYREAMSRQFVLERETVTLIDDLERLGALMDTFMSGELARDFSTLMQRGNKKSPLNLHREKQIIKKVEIQGSRPHPTSENCIEVDWVAHYIHKPSKRTVEKKSFRSIVKSRYAPRAMTKKQMLTNPLALEVIDYFSEEN